MLAKYNGLYVTVPLAAGTCIYQVCTLRTCSPHWPRNADVAVRSVPCLGLILPRYSPRQSARSVTGLEHGVEEPPAALNIRRGLACRPSFVVVGVASVAKRVERPLM
jgi:hypothetical protein